MAKEPNHKCGPIPIRIRISNKFLILGPLFHVQGSILARWHHLYQKLVIHFILSKMPVPCAFHALGVWIIMIIDSIKDYEDPNVFIIIAIEVLYNLRFVLYALAFS